MSMFGSKVRDIGLLIGLAVGGAGCASTNQYDPRQDNDAAKPEAPATPGVILGKAPAPTPPPAAAPVPQPAAAPVAQPEPAQGPAAGRIDSEHNLSDATMPAVPQRPPAPQIPAPTVEQLEARQQLIAKVSGEDPLLFKMMTHSVRDPSLPGTPPILSKANAATPINLDNSFTVPVLGQDLISDPRRFTDADLASGLALARRIRDIDTYRDDQIKIDYTTADGKIKKMNGPLTKSIGGSGKDRNDLRAKSMDDLIGATEALMAWQVNQAGKMHPTATVNPYAGQGGYNPSNGATNAGNGAGYDGRPLNGDQIQRVTGFTPAQLVHLSKGERNQLIDQVVDIAKLQDIIANPPNAWDAQELQRNQITLAKRELDLASRQENLRYKVATNEAKVEDRWRKLEDADKRRDEQQRHREVKNIENEIGGALGLILKGIKVFDKF